MKVLITGQEYGKFKINERAKLLVDSMNLIDGFERIRELLRLSQKYISIETIDTSEAKSLSSIFLTNKSKDFSEGSTRRFNELYTIVLSDKSEYECRLSNQWQETNQNAYGHNSLAALEMLVKKYYEDRIIISTRNNYNEGKDVIYYGVPGVGKSYKIKKKCENEIFEQEKTVFHPEYTNADFVGQLLPVRNKNVNTSEGNTSNNADNKQSSISYEFVPGPFTRILAKALKNKHDPDKKYMLVIDEINRGNAAAIFGEIFQLLDRDESGKSEFGISNKDIYDYLIEKEGVDKSLLPDEKIYLPPNLYIWATMNTSDQNVYTLDTAFQRRWQMEMLTIDFDKDDTKAQGEIQIPNTKSKLTWKEFVTAINDKISEKNEGMISVEDKRIGPWFAKKNEIEDKNLFTQKVIKYLWDDAFKMSRTEVFKDVKTLDEIVDKINKGSNIENIFDEEIFDKVLNNRNVNNKDNQETEIEDTNE